MGYTDKELRDATQIAYMDLKEGYKYLFDSGLTPPYSVRQIVDATTDIKLKNKLEEKIEAGDISIDLDSWKIAQIHDTNNKNGFYGCIIETSDTEAIVAFRGSESENEQFKYDWIDADIGLVNSKQTSQHIEVEVFLNDIQNNGYLNKYTSVASTGHSLGGNLSDCFTILAMDYSFGGKITQSVSYDGPGFSNEFLKNKKEDIAKASKVMTHMQWSAVGGLLFPVPGVESVIVDISDYEDTTTYVQEEYNKLFYDFIAKHDTRSIVYDEAGNILPGEMDAVTWFMGKLTRGFDRLPSNIGNSITNVLTYFLLHGEEIKGQLVNENGLTLLGAGLVAAFAIKVLSNPAGTLIQASKVITGTVSTILGLVGIECIIEFFESATEKVSELVSKGMKWGKEKIAEFQKVLNAAALQIKEFVKDAGILFLKKSIQGIVYAMKKYKDAKKYLTKWEALKKEAQKVCISLTALARVSISQLFIRKLLEAKSLLLNIENTVQNIKIAAIESAKEKITLAGEIAKTLGKNFISRVKKKYNLLANITIFSANKFGTLVTSKIRDYSEDNLQLLKGLYDSIAAIEFYDMYRWNRLYSCEKWFGRLNISYTQSAFKSLIESAREAGISLLQTTTGVFEEIQALDDSFAGFLNGKTDELNAIAGLLD